MRRRKRIVEDSNIDTHIYRDKSTGTEYVFRGGRLVPIPKPNFDDEDKEREEQIKKEQEEREKRGFKVKRETPEEREKRIKRLKDVLDDSGDKFKKESQAHADIDKRNRREKKREEERIQKARGGKSISAFEHSIKNFIKKQCGEVEDELTYHRLNKKYSTSSLIKPGRRKKEDIVPLLVAYLDRSSSWGPSDTAVAEKVINSFSNYVKEGLLEIRMKEFGSTVVDYGAGGHGGSTNGQPIIDDIKEINPTNVVIMTDGDIGRWSGNQMTESVTVPGGVWLIFKQTKDYRNEPEDVWVNPNVIDHVKGKKKTEIFKIPYGE